MNEWPAGVTSHIISTVAQFAFPPIPRQGLRELHLRNVCYVCIYVTVCGSVFLFVETFVSAAVLLLVANPGDADKWQSLCLQLQSLPRPTDLAVPVTAILHVCPIAKCSASTYVRPYLLTLSCSHPCPQSIQYSSVDNDINYILARGFVQS